MSPEKQNNKFNDSIITKLQAFVVQKKQQGFTFVQKILFIIALIILLCIIIWVWRTFIHPSKKEHRNQLTNVVLATAQSADVPVYLNALGSVTPTDSVTVKTQVDGQMQEVFFKEGQMVKTNTLLAQIDERPFRAVLMQNEGQLAHDLASLENARLDLLRYRTLWMQDSISKQTLDTQASLVKQLEGTVKSDQGLVNAARVNLIFCRIISPIDGRIGLRLVDPGNFVQTTDTTGLFVINKLNPITVVFTIPEDNIPQVLKNMKPEKPLIVEAYDRTQSTLLEIGKLFAIDNQIDSTTGMVKLKAEFANKENKLFPNQFVNTRLLVDTLKNATIVPTPAIQHGTHDFVYLYESKTQTVHVTPIKTGIVEGENTVIASGLKPGDKVVVEGTDKLVNGAKVNVSQTQASNNSTTGSHLRGQQ